MITLSEVKAKSSKRLEGLNKVVKAATEQLIERSFAAGVPILIAQGYRSIAEQDALYAQGRTKPGSIVTNARGGYSNHNFGLAVDFALLLPDGKNVSWTVNNDWMTVVGIAKQLGFAWGGDWTSFKDYPHFEMLFGLTTVQLRAGQRPTAAQEAAAMARIKPSDNVNEKEDDKLELSKYQRETLVKALQGMLDRKVISDKAWVDKAEKGTLTASELLWLNTILIANK
ncbi:M15 family metallopeptidase [Paenibacillus sp. GCM10027626]|uniref:M15 family metallopeptidase n=1 Tax=Paenibacillus sp. GCM10027626 TaxID=3273411 RepID=UPI003636B84E